MNAASAPVTSDSRLSGTTLRTVSAVVMMVPALAAVYFGPPWFTALVLAGAAVMGWEWSRMCGGDAKWMLAGAIYIAVPAGVLIWLRADAMQETGGLLHSPQSRAPAESSSDTSSTISVPGVLWM